MFRSHSTPRAAERAGALRGLAWQIAIAAHLPRVAWLRRRKRGRRALQ